MTIWQTCAEYVEARLTARHCHARYRAAEALAASRRVACTFATANRAAWRYLDRCRDELERDQSLYQPHETSIVLERAGIPRDA